MTDRRSAALTLALAAVFFAGGLVLLPVPFTRDQGIYAYVAWRWLGGAPPYLGSFDHKGPLLYLVYMAALKTSGGAMWGPNLFDLLARTAAVLAAWLLGRRLAGPAAALYAAALTAAPLFGVFNSCWWNAQAETFMLPLLGLSAWLALDPRRRPALLLAAGLLAAQAAMLKPTGLLHGSFLLAWLALAPGDGRRRAVVCFGAGLAAGIGGWIGYFAAVGALGAMWEVLVVFNAIHGAAAGLGATGRAIHTFLGGTGLVFSIMPLLLIPLLLPRPATEHRGFAVLFLLASFLQVMVQGRFFLYHWLTLIPAAGLAAGIGLHRLHAAVSARRPVAGAVVVAIILAWLAYGYFNIWRLVLDSYRTLDYVEGRISMAEYYSRFSEAGRSGRGDFNLLASVAAADYLRHHVPAGDTALVFGFEPIVNYLSARPAPTRFEIDYPLTFTPRSEAAAHMRDRWRRQFLGDLSSRPPAMVVVVDNDANALEPATSAEQARAFTEFWDWLQKNYQRADAIEDFTFYRRK